MKALFITALVLFLLLLLLQTRLRLFVLYRAEGAQIRVGFGVFRYTVYPPKPKKTKPKKAKTARKKKKPNKQTDNKLMAMKDGMSLSLAQELLEIAMDALGRMKRALRIDELWIRINWGMDDPADAALSYGAANAAMGVFIALLEENVRVKRRHSEINLDYRLEKPNVYLRAACSFTLWQACSLGLRVGGQALRLYRRQKHKTVKNKETVLTK